MKLTHDAKHEINLIERDPEPEEPPPVRDDIPEVEITAGDIECLLGLLEDDLEDLERDKRVRPGARYQLTVQWLKELRERGR